MPQPIIVRALKFDGSEHRRWSAELAHKHDQLLVLDAAFAEDVDHDLLGHISKGTSSTEYYWLDRWYNVFRFGDDSGALRNFYCNVIAPPIFNGNTLSYVDLDIDLLVAPDMSYRLLDVEDFETHAIQFSYPEEVRARAFQAVEDLVSLIRARAFPFDTK